MGVERDPVAETTSEDVEATDAYTAELAPTPEEKEAEEEGLEVETSSKTVSTDRHRRIETRRYSEVEAFPHHYELTDGRWRLVKDSHPYRRALLDEGFGGDLPLLGSTARKLVENNMREWVKDGYDRVHLGDGQSWRFIRGILNGYSGLPR